MKKDLFVGLVFFPSFVSTSSYTGVSIPIDKNWFYFLGQVLGTNVSKYLIHKERYLLF